MLTPQQQKKAFNAIILTQCLGMLTAICFQNGFYLNYFSKLGISSASIATLFALPPFLAAFLLLPFAFLSDRKGKMKMALAGQIMMVASVLVLMMAGWWDEGRITMLLVVGSMLIFCIGGSLQGSNWFALLGAIVPEKIRGRFFGRLRVTFITVSILFTLMVTRVLKVDQSMSAFQILLGILLLAHIIRYFTYRRIPELEHQHGDELNRDSFGASIAAVFRVEGFNRFNGYFFLITLFTAGVPIIFALMQKDVFHFTPAQITLIGTFFLAGSVAGNLVGGHFVDRYGTRLVFFVTHMQFAVILLGMLMRYWVPWSLPVHAALCAFLFNLIQGVLGIATTSEMLALIPPANKSLSTAVSTSLFNLGTAISGLFVARSISWSLLPAGWKIQGHIFSAYDSLLLLFTALILILLAAIGLVPKIIKKAQLMPGSGYPRI